jgi:FkbM family methyltransferase
MLSRPAHALRHPRAAIRAVHRHRFERRMRSLDVSAVPGLKKLGSSDAGWTVPADSIDASWTCWCVGAGADVTFDIDLLNRHGARVRSFDPFHVFGEMAQRQANDNPLYSFHEVAVAPADGPLIMWGRQDLEQGGVSAVNLYGTRQSFERPGKTLATLKNELGDERVDLLKLDIEGSEYDVLENADLKALGVRVLCIELHGSVPARRAIDLVDGIRSQGYMLVHREDPVDLTFTAAD